MIEIKRQKLGKLPTKPGKLLDRMWLLKMQKEALEAELVKVKADIKTVEETIFKCFKSNELDSARGDSCQATIGSRIVPVAKDWPKVFEYVKKQRGLSGFDLLQKRLGSKAVEARWEDGIKIPGIIKDSFDVLHVKKLK